MATGAPPAGLLLLVLVMALSGCGTADGKQERAVDDLIRPLGVTQGSEVQLAPDLPTMAASSDLVVVADVIAVRRGRAVGDAGNGIRFREVDVRPVDLLNGPSQMPATLLLEQEGWQIDGATEHSYAPEGLGWLQVGTRVLLFLVDKGGEEAGRYRAISSQGTYQLVGADIRPVPAPLPSDEPLVAEVASLDQGQVAAAVDAATEAGASGAVMPITAPASNGAVP
jgi:hypothetical protein